MSADAKKNGGKREGAGRKSGTGPFREDTSVMRVPNSQKPVITNFLEAYARKQRLSQLTTDLDRVGAIALPAVELQDLSLPLYQSKVPAGLPSPADSDVDSRIDINRLLIKNPDKTFFATIQGESMIEAGYMPGDIAIVERGKEASIGDTVMAMIDGEFTIKTLAKQKNGDPKLLPANSSGKYQPILILKQMQFEIWGVVIGSFRSSK